MFIRLPDGFHVNPDLIFGIGPGGHPQATVLYGPGERKHTVLGHPQSAVVACLGDGWSEKPFEPDQRRTDAADPPPTTLRPKRRVLLCCHESETAYARQNAWPQADIALPTVTHLEGRRWDHAYVTPAWLAIMADSRAMDVLMTNAVVAEATVEIVPVIPLYTEE